MKNIKILIAFAVFLFCSDYAMAQKYEFEFTCLNPRDSGLIITGYSGWLDERISNHTSIEKIVTSGRLQTVDYRYMQSCHDVCLRLIPLDGILLSFPSGEAAKNAFDLRRKRARTGSAFNSPIPWEDASHYGSPDTIEYSTVSGPSGRSNTMLKACWKEKWTNNHWLAKYYKNSDPNWRFITQVDFTDARGETHQFFVVPYTHRWHHNATYRE